MKNKMMIKVAQLMLLMVVALVVVAQTHSTSLTEDDEATNLELPTQAGGYEVERPCCDTCACTESIPPQCRCRDWKQGGCHPNCQKCEQLPARIFPPLFVCSDVSAKCAEPCRKIMLNDDENNN